MSDNMQAAARTASSLLHQGGGTPARNSEGDIDPEVFFEWIGRAREIADEKDRSEVTDSIIGAWLADWPCDKDPESWPEIVIADLLEREDCEGIRRGFCTGIYNSRGVSSRMPYDGGGQEREIAAKFSRYVVVWRDVKPNLALMIESIAEGFERRAQRHDDDGQWTQES